VRGVRVALVSPYALSVFGGVQEQTLAMSRELIRRGHDVLIVAPDGRDHAIYDTPAAIERFGWLLSLPANGSRAPLTLSPLAIRRAWFVVQNFKPDVVHFHEPFSPMIGWGVLRTHRAPAVATFHRSGAGPTTSTSPPQ
jgi:phosphatidylinositol alpha-mannosyltransferase